MGSTTSLDKQFVKFCNEMRCPLCGSQLDGVIHSLESKLYCVSDNSEYQCTLSPDYDVPLFELLTFYYPQYIYEIKSDHLGSDLFHTYIDRFNTDHHPMHRRRYYKKVFDYTGERLMMFRSRMDEEVFLKKLKLYTLFS